MRPEDLIVVIFVVSVFAVFAVTLAFASWDETRRMRAITKDGPAAAPTSRQDFQLVEKRLIAL